MEKGGTKAQILDAALDLFSVQGYEATSIAQLAEAVGIRKASLYGHFTNKQDILDTLLQDTMEEFNRRSIFVHADWDDPAFTADKHNLSVDAVCQMVQGQISFITRDPRISKIRKLLTIEQFRNPELKTLQTEQSYELILRYNTGLMRHLIREGVLRDEDAEIMAAQFAWPISMWMSLCDREPEREAEAMTLLERHVRQFFRVYGTGMFKMLND